MVTSISAVRLRVVIAVAGCLAIGACGSDESDDREKTVAGKGYDFTAPKGWADRSDTDPEDLEFAGFRPDTLVVADEVEGFRANVNVVREGSIPEHVDSDDYARLATETLKHPERLGGEAGEELSKLRPREFSAPRDTELDGEEAVTQSYTSEREDKLLRFRQVLAVREGVAYTVTYTALRDRFPDDLPGYERMLRSWHWRG
jgi:hypothetical protein